MSTALRTTSYLDGPGDQDARPAGSTRTALCVGYRPPLNYASAVASAVSKYGIISTRVGGDYSAAAWEAKNEAFEAVLDLLFGPRPTEQVEALRGEE